jgi:hypothetical protein
MNERMNELVDELMGEMFEDVMGCWMRDSNEWHFWLLLFTNVVETFFVIYSGRG